MLGHKAKEVDAQEGHNCLASSKLPKMEVGKLKFLSFEIIRQCH